MILVQSDSSNLTGVSDDKVLKPCAIETHKDDDVKTKIVDAKQALDDIRSGMGDLALMQKYKLSSKGLQSLFRKLGAAGLLTQINAKEVITDLRKGMTDQEMMKKYALSSKGLEALLADINRRGLLRRPPEKDTLPTKIVVKVPQIVQDIRSRVGRPELLKRYSLTPRALRWVCMMLVSSGAIGWHEIYGNICEHIEELVPEKLRESRRSKLGLEVPVYEMGSPKKRGIVRDVSEKGIGLRGIRAKIGETKTIVIYGDEFGEYASFALDVVCKWVSKDPSGEYVAGFEIHNISVASQGEFQWLIEMARLTSPGS